MIKYFKINNIIASLMLLGAFTLQACDDNNSFDITGNPNNLVYLKIEGQANTALTYTVVTTPIGIENNISGKYPVRIQNAIAEDLTATVEVNRTLLDAYNTANKTSYLAVPDGLLNINNTTLTIKSGEVVSADSISITANESMLSALEIGKTYLLPLQITSISTHSANISSNMDCIYVVITTVYNEVRKNGGAADMVGTLITSYTGWTYSSDYTTGAIANLWTTSTSSRMNFTAQKPVITFDMQAERKVSGVRIYARSSNNAAYRLNNAKLFLSKDGTTFERIADLSISQMAYASYYQYICMYTGVEARYLRLELDFVTEDSGYWSLVNLGVYAE